MDDWMVLVAALALGFALGAITITVAVLTRRKAKLQPVEPEIVETAIVEPAPALGPAHRAADIPTEWAMRFAEPLAAGRVKGVCSGCGAALSVTDRRPLKIACPECGRTRLLA